jgi:lysozyme family protein
MSSVDSLIQDVLAREGGFVDHPADRGGPTKFGVTLATLTRHLGRPATVAELKALTQAQAGEIYRRDYLRRPQLDRLPDRIRPFLFDAAVNHGTGRAVRFLQRVCRQAGFGALAEDGVCGAATQTAAEHAEVGMGAWLLAALIEERRRFYHRIVQADRSQTVFLKGWLNRLASFERQVEGLLP